MFKKTFAGFLACLLCQTGLLAGELLVASSYSDRYHKASCKVVKKILSDEKVTFSSDEEAKAAGYKPCTKCHPHATPANFGKK